MKMVDLSIATLNYQRLNVYKCQVKDTFCCRFLPVFFPDPSGPVHKNWATSCEDTEQALEELEQKFAVLRKTREVGDSLFIWEYLSIITGYKWDYIFYKWGYKYL